MLISNDVGIAGYLNKAIAFYSAGFKHLYFIKELFEIYHAPGANNRFYSEENSGGNMMGNKPLSLVIDGVPCIASSIVTEAMSVSALA
jgi:hypothetical protein